jgi:probable HAF family extracellular repeat protein
MNLRAFFLGAALIAAACISPVAAQTYTFQVVECGQYTAYPFAMNNQGTIVGGAQTISSTYALAFVYANGGCKTISLGTQGTSFRGITDTNQILGLFGTHQNYLEQGGVFTGLPSYPGAALTYYCCLNASGLLAGNYRPTNIDPYGTGFFYHNGKWATLPLSTETGYWSLYGLNDKGVAVGTFYGVSLSGFTYENGTLTYLQYPGAKYTTFNGINDNGIIVGTYVLKVSNASGIFSYNLSTAVWTDLKFPWYYSAVLPVGINNAGVIAAEFTPSGGLFIATPQP